MMQTKTSVFRLKSQLCLLFFLGSHISETTKLIKLFHFTYKSVIGLLLWDVLTFGIGDKV